MGFYFIPIAEFIGWSNVVTSRWDKTILFSFQFVGNHVEFKILMIEQHKYQVDVPEVPNSNFNRMSINHACQEQISTGALVFEINPYSWICDTTLFNDMCKFMYIFQIIRTNWSKLVVMDRHTDTYECSYCIYRILKRFLCCRRYIRQSRIGNRIICLQTRPNTNSVDQGSFDSL